MKKLILMFQLQMQAGKLSISLSVTTNLAVPLVIKNISLGSAQAIQFTYKDSNRLTTVYTFVMKDNIVYIIRASSGTKDETVDATNYQLMKKIVDTFRFTS